MNHQVNWLEFCLKTSLILVLPLLFLVISLLKLAEEWMFIIGISGLFCFFIQQRYCLGNGWFRKSAEEGYINPQNYLGANPQQFAECRPVEEELQQCQQLLANVLESITEGFFAVDRQWRLTYVNQKAEQFLQRSRQELLGKNIWEAVPDAIEQFFWKQSQQAVADGVAVAWEGFYPPLNAWLEVRAYPSQVGLSIYFCDITARKQAEERCTFQASLLNQVRHAAIAIDLEGRVTYWNPFAEQMFQWQAAEVIGKPLFELIIPPEYRGIAQEITTAMVQSGYWEGEFTVCRKNGTTFPVYVVDTVLRDSQGNLSGYLGMSIDISDRKDAEQALRESEERYRTLVKNFPNGAAFLFDRNLRYIIADGKALQWLHLSKEKLEGKTIWECFPPEICTDLEPLYQATLAGNIVVAETNYAHRIYANQILPIADSQGEVVAGMAVALDITEQKQVEVALRESEERYRLLFNNSNDMVFVHGVNSEGEVTSFTAVNNTACLRLGYNREELLVLTPSDILSPQTIQEGSAIMALLLTQKHALFEASLVAREGRYILVEVNAHLFDFRGQPTILSIARDITDRKQTEAALRRSEAQFRQIFASAPIGMALVSLQGELVQVNQTLCELLGYSESELKGINLREISHPKDCDREFALMAQLMGGEITSYQLETRYLKPNGEVVWASLTCGLLQDPDTQEVCKLAMFENITERRTVERMKDNFVSVVSHEMRTPLTSICGALGLLATGQLGYLCSDGEELLNIAFLESQRLVRLVSDILDLERIKSGHLTFVKAACQVAELMERAIESTKAIAEQAGITLEVTLVSEVVWADCDRILQTLTNLLNNAIKFSAANSTIWLRAERYQFPELDNREEGENLNVSPVVLISVQDQGRGIPADKLEAIFEPFEQVDASDSRQKGGTGLGLAICRHIVQQHGGQIWVQSQLGKGSHFFFTLPILKEN